MKTLYQLSCASLLGLSLVATAQSDRLPEASMSHDYKSEAYQQGLFLERDKNYDGEYRLSSNDNHRDPQGGGVDSISIGTLKLSHDRKVPVIVNGKRDKTARSRLHGEFQ